MYLKRMEIFGFKSFGRPVKINFHNGINGIVGPNGSGKSNISDAVKWVFGSNSKEALRTSDSEDIIFKGNGTEEPLNFAEVKLIFDNEDLLLPYETKEVEICKRAYRDDQENEYYINRIQVRLKDIQNLLWDLGISKNSLALISQGNLTEFITSSPEKKRAIFEEAAGIAKYRQRKIESVRKLERTEENLAQVQNIIDEISRHLGYLEKQAKKAEKYLEIKNNLQQIEISWLAYNLKNLNEKKNNVLEILNELKIKQEYLTTELTKQEAQINSAKNKLDIIDLNISTKQEQLTKNIDKLEKIKTTNDHDKSSSEDWNLKILENERTVKEEKLKELVDFIDSNRHQLEILDREIVLLEQKLLLNQEKKFNLQFQISNLNSKNQYSHGIDFLLKNSMVVNGIIDIVENLLLPKEEKYNIAVSSLLSSTRRNLVVNTKATAQKCIEILKNNKLGRVTFIPLDNIISREIDEQSMFVLSKQQGYIGVATSLIQFDKKYDVLAKNLLGRSIVVDTFDNASNIFLMLNKKYFVVSLDGSVFNPSGMVTGGNLKLDSIYNSVNLKKLEEEFNDTLNLIKEIQVKIVEARGTIQNNEKNNQNFLINVKLLEKELEEISFKLSKFESSLGKNLDSDINGLLSEKENLKQSLNSLHDERLYLVNNLIAKESQYKLLLNEEKEVNHNIHEGNMQILGFDKDIASYLNRLVEEYQITYELALERFKKSGIEITSELTHQIHSLKNEMNELLPVNIDSIELYNQEKTRFDFLSKQYTEINQAKSEILNTLSDLDKIIVEKFGQIIIETNKYLPTTLSKLAGHGEAKIYFLDPNNILETGIDLQINLPGKKINNLNLLSGGEKSLVALATLFAILCVKPLPFVILDEAEAALDISNVTRFANYLREVKNTQFIVVTHRSGTMEKCESLCGITMEEKGISKVVGISLESAKEMIDKTNVTSL
ncbi:MAG: AAA family ATPase [Mycoplasma sp.]